MEILNIKSYQVMKLIKKCLYYLRIQVLMRYLFRKKIIILMYHGFTDKKIHGGIENHEGQSLNIETFRLQIEYLKKYYNIISLFQLIDRYNKGVEIRDNSVVITIDDGYKSHYTLAYPILKKYNVPATIFITTNFVDNKEFLWSDRIEYAINRTELKDFKLKIGNDIISLNIPDKNSKILCDMKLRLELKAIPQELRDEIVDNLERSLGHKLSIDADIPEIYRPLEWDEILEMIKSGIISIGSHTHTHSILTQCSPANMDKEVQLPLKIIKNRTGLDCKLFSYPNGKVGDFDSRTKELLEKYGYICGITAVVGMNDENSNIFELKRLGKGSNNDWRAFVINLCAMKYIFKEMKQALR